MTTNQSNISQKQPDSPRGTSPLTKLRDPVKEVSTTQIDPGGNEFGFGEKMNQGKISLHGQGETFFNIFEQNLGFELPRSPNTAITNEHITALWQSPYEWLIVVPETAQSETLVRLRRLFDGQHVMLVDVSDRWLQISIAGQPAFEVLRRGTSVDLETCLTAAGDCIQTLLGLVPVIIHRNLDLPAFDIYVDRSYAEYLWRWLENAASDFDLQYIDFDLEDNQQSES